jgi:hypothetical protein
MPMQKASKRPASNKRDKERQAGIQRVERASRTTTRERDLPRDIEEPAGERKRDEQRESSGPQYGGEPWSAADRRQPDERFGGARNDDAEPLEMIRGGGNNDDDESPAAADPDVAAAEETRSIESGGAREGFGRGEKPRKLKQRTKPNPKRNTKTKKKSKGNRRTR